MIDWRAAARVRYADEVRARPGENLVFEWPGRVVVERPQPDRKGDPQIIDLFAPPHIEIGVDLTIPFYPKHMILSVQIPSWTFSWLRDWQVRLPPKLRAFALDLDDVWRVQDGLRKTFIEFSWASPSLLQAVLEDLYPRTKI